MTFGVNYSKLPNDRDMHGADEITTSMVSSQYFLKAYREKANTEF